MEFRAARFLGMEFRATRLLEVEFRATHFGYHAGLGQAGLPETRCKAIRGALGG